MADKDVRDIRRTYDHDVLLEEDAGMDPFALFSRWFDQALASEMEGTAMTLSTGGEHPSSRTVLLKEFRNGEFVFFTNYASQKGQAISNHPNVSLLFFWQTLQRQVRIEGRATKVSEQESVDYFQSRPFESQIGALASHQSDALVNREELDQRYEDLLEVYRNKTVPKPDHWGGYAVIPERIEFWQGRPSRLHDRLLYIKSGNNWQRKRLSP
ncbi:MAG: pyridoxamine 5'-phosphate oxidase [Bacteroidetes bacterium]|nr:pyridoxamine 5'-phosphate oxidase [Bacteroidota bacterium]